MKNNLMGLLVFIFILTGFSVCGAHNENSSDEGDRASYQVQEFVHPGILHNMDDLEFMKMRVNNGDEPWLSAYQKMLSWKGSSLDWVAKPVPNVHRDSYGANRVGDPAITHDGEAAYSHALQWVITGNEAHAEKAKEILNAWSATLETITGKDDNLLAGMAAQKYCNAAEILMYTYDGWPESEVDQFKNMLLTVYLPLISNFYTNSPNSNGNWGLSMVNSVLAIAVFCDDVDLFNGAVAHVMRTSRQPYSTLSGYIDAETGQCQESGRDQGHSQMGLGYLGAICEIAWKQDIDLYAYLDNRLLLGMEYTAAYGLGNEVPYYNMYDKFKDRISEKSRGNFEPIFERVYNHYVRVKGLSMPFTEQVIEQERPEGFTSSMTSWGTLTAYQEGLEEETPTASAPNK
ncbi:alginate lyase family protein [Pontiellaceae bacterium B1224]|nr:alginate lyase family protein [Pontiellaceae bacterium B1224]